MKPLEKDDIKTIIKRAVYDEKKGMGSYKAVIDDDALEFLADISNGDARNALNAVELGILTTDRSEDGFIHIDIETARNVSRNVQSDMIKRAITIMIQYLHLLRVCEDQIRML